MQMLAGAVSKVLDTAAGEAGRQSWAALVRIAKKWRARSGAGEESLRELENPPDAAGIDALAKSLETAAASDPALAYEFANWHHSVTVVVSGAGDVSSTVSGTIHGPVVQARDVSGPITFN